MGLDADYRTLERQLRGTAHEEFLREIRSCHPLLRGFGAWAEVVTFMRKGSSGDPRKDIVLRVIFESRQGEGDRRWQTVLLVLFWPALRAIHRQKSHWDEGNDDDRWQNVLCAFLATISRIDVEKRSDQLASRIYNGTVNRLYRAYARDWICLERECELPEEDSGDLELGEECLELAAVDVFDEKEWEIKKLRQYREDGIITEAELYLAIGTRVYGAALAEYARERELPYETVKKRSQRLDAKIRRCEKKL